MYLKISRGQHGYHLCVCVLCVSCTVLFRLDHSSIYNIFINNSL